MPPNRFRLNVQLKMSVFFTLVFLGGGKKVYFYFLVYHCIPEVEYNFSCVDGIIFDSTEENVYTPILGVAVYFQKMPKINFFMLSIKKMYQVILLTTDSLNFFAINHIVMID